VVQRIVDELGGTERGMLDASKTFLMGMVKRSATNILKHGRSGLTSKISGTVGDILMYQARGQAIRDFIRGEIGKYPGPVVLLGHSLGGIACVDLLLEPDPPKVALLVTIGSQAPLLYEINALSGMSYAPNATLPSSFPQWLNIYDKDDLLSYIGGRIFPSQVEDFHVGSGKPFPDSHGAYWKDNNDTNEGFDKTVATLKTVNVGQIHG
jgi:pimeloyl-ACP methyl ester carboxylesterase